VVAGVAALLSGVGGVTWACSAAERGHDSGDGLGQATLTGFASLPARTFVPGSPPAGGQLGTDPINGLTAPFADQPVQGFSAIVANGDGTFDVLEDNGFGKKNNSADFLLHIVRIRPDFHRGRIEVVGGVNLTEPDKRVPFGLTRSDRVLTERISTPSRSCATVTAPTGSVTSSARSCCTWTRPAG
jgi:hypothetical protein